jgi:hypothetical protein
VSRDNPPRFADRGTAVIYAAGLRLLSGDEEPARMDGWCWSLIEGGRAVKLRFPTKSGMMCCIADLPARMTDRELLTQSDWFAWEDDDDADGALAFIINVPCEGSA